MLAHTQNTLDFGEFMETWTPKVRSAVYRAGFVQHHATDLMQDIFADLFKGGYLEKWDAEKGEFAPYIWSHIRFRIKGRKRDLWRRGSREVAEVAAKPWSNPSYVDKELESAEWTDTLRSAAYLLEEGASNERSGVSSNFSVTSLT